jgi:hypothetical protein
MERRAPTGPKGSMRWIRSILGRPLGLQRRPDGLHVTLLDRRRSPEVVQAESMARLREELRLRLLDLEHHHATTAMRHLVHVHDVLGRKGWAGLQNAKSEVLRMAILQVQMLVEREPSNRLGRFVERLRMIQAAAEAREERVQSQASALAAGEAVQVSEATAEEFEASQRDWDATRPAELAGPEHPPAPAASPAAATPAAPAESRHAPA